MTGRLSVPALTPRRAVALMVLLAVVGGGAAFALASTRPSTWRASRQALIRVWSTDSLVLTGQSTDVTPTNLSDAATVVTSSDVLNAAVASLNEPSVTRRSLAAHVTASASQTSDFVGITVTGPSAAEADRRAKAVAAAFVTVVRQKVLASAAQVADLAGTTGQAGEQIRTRAQALSASTPVQIYQADRATRTGAGVLKLTALGLVVGLAVAALLVVALTFAAPRLRRPGDVVNSLGLPAMTWSSRDAAAVDGVGAELVQAVARGPVAVCAARPEDAQAADGFGRWLSGPVDDPDESVPRRPSPLSGVVHIGSPVDGLAVTRPPASAIGAAVLVTTAGTPTDTVQRAAELFGGWRAIDAVVLVR